ncbi:MAG: TRAP transporter small permease, partial [Pseudomonadota bacterium]
MAEAALSPGARMLARVDAGFFKLEKFLNLIASLVILGVMFIGVFQVFGRKLLNFPVPGYVDIIEMVMTVFAFVAIAYCQRLGG